MQLWPTNENPLNVTIPKPHKPYFQKVREKHRYEICLVNQTYNLSLMGGHGP